MNWVAYYAPLKSPDHPTPSGDREMARNLKTAVAQATGLPVHLAATLRSRDGVGDVRVQQRLMAQADAIAQELVARWRPNPPRLWITYHNYYKAPDLIGPSVARALSVPYVLIEATRARKRLNGPWAMFAQQAEAATDAAKLVFYMTAHDRDTLERDRPAGQRLIHLPPFLPACQLPKSGTGAGPMLSVGMMRPGDKLASYRLLAETLSLVETPDWRLDIVGDGPTRAEVAELMRPLGNGVRFHGALPRDALDRLYANASLFLWPGVNEAYGMVYLEAQSYGVPVIAQDRPGVRDVLARQASDTAYPSPEQGTAALAARIDAMLTSPTLRDNAACAARAHIARDHLLPAARDRITLGLKPLLEDLS